MNETDFVYRLNNIHKTFFNSEGDVVARGCDGVSLELAQHRARVLCTWTPGRAQ